LYQVHESLHRSDTRRSLEGARRRYRSTERHLREMVGDGWPDSRTKAEIGKLRGILREANAYDPVMDQIREFDLLRIVLGSWSPREAAEKRLAMEYDMIRRCMWVEYTESFPH
jgi:hypothetical protein